MVVKQLLWQARRLAERRLFSPLGIKGLSYLFSKEKGIKLLSPLRRRGSCLLSQEERDKIVLCVKEKGTKCALGIKFVNL
jgi:hypothetical protein